RFCARSRWDSVRGRTGVRPIDSPGGGRGRKLRWRQLDRLPKSCVPEGRIWHKRVSEPSRGVADDPFERQGVSLHCGGSAPPSDWKPHAEWQPVSSTEERLEMILAAGAAHTRCSLLQGRARRPPVSWRSQTLP